MNVYLFLRIVINLRFLHSVKVELCLLYIIDRSFGGQRSFNFRRTDFGHLNTVLSFVEWSSVLISLLYDSLSLDRILVGLHEVLFKCFRECVPFINSSLERSSPPWNSCRLLRLRDRKSKLLKKFVGSCTDIDYAFYSRERADYRRMNHYCYEECMVNVRSNFAIDPQSSYDFVRAKRKSFTFPPEMCYGYHPLVTLIFRICLLTFSIYL